MPQFAIIIPCYNHGRFIKETIASVEEVGNKDLYELIIVNDGSTDEYTNQVLREMSDAGYNVIFSENKGLSAARNLGIRNSTAPYILPLDSDNKITPEYLYHSAEILDSHPEISIVYSDAQLFGVEHTIRISGEHQLQKLMVDSYIDACAVIRREVWEDLGGFDEFFRAGYEDWEFFLHASFKGYKFHYINQPLFHYRVERNSMIHQLNRNKIKANQLTEYIINKHPHHFGPQYIDENMDMKFKLHPVAFVVKMILRNYFPARFQKMVAQGKLRKYL